MSPVPKIYQDLKGHKGPMKQERPLAKSRDWGIWEFLCRGNHIHPEGIHEERRSVFHGTINRQVFEYPRYRKDEGLMLCLLSTLPKAKSGVAQRN